MNKHETDLMLWIVVIVGVIIYYFLKNKKYNKRLILEIKGLIAETVAFSRDNLINKINVLIDSNLEFNATHSLPTNIRGEFLIAFLVVSVSSITYDDTALTYDKKKLKKILKILAHDTTISVSFYDLYAEIIENEVNNNEVKGNPLDYDFFLKTISFLASHKNVVHAFTLER